MTGTDGGDFATSAYNATTGAKLWDSSYAPTTTEVAFSLAVSPDGSKVFATGRVGSPSCTTQLGTVDYSTS